MKKILQSLFTLFLVLSATVLLAQQVQQNGSQSPADLANAALKEMQQSDPQSAQAFQDAIQKGDVMGAKKIYQDFKKKQQASQGASVTSDQTATVPPAAPAQPSLFEQTLSGNFSQYLPPDIKQFGYDLFNKTVSTFTPSGTMPVGPDYILGPGDQFTLTLWGTTEGIYTVQVSKEGEITLPKVGVVSVAGVRFGELEHTLKRHLSKYFSNFNLSVAMGTLKTVTVYVVGEVTNPGSYPVPSLTTVYGALFTAGGPTKQGTLRKIQVLRNGRVIKTVDLYDFLLKGDRSQDIPLQNGDTVFVPLIGPLAGVSGMVYRPAIYELKGRETIDDLLKTAGGILPMGFGGRLQLTRYQGNQKRIIVDVNVNVNVNGGDKRSAALSEKVMNMDLVAIQPVYNPVWESVTLKGAVEHPGDMQWRPDLRIKEVIRNGGLLPTSDLKRAEIVRMSDDFHDRQVLPVNLEAALKGDESQNILLKPQDQITVFTMFKKAETIMLSGEVMSPGTYQITQGERLSDVLRRAGGFTSDAYPYGAVFKRLEIKTFQSKQLDSFILSMQKRLLQVAADQQASAISGEEASVQKTQMMMTQQLIASLKTQQEQAEGRVALNITADIDTWASTDNDPVLQDGDSFSVSKAPQEVSVIGEVYNPGAVAYDSSRDVKEYIGMTGGFTDYASKDEVFVVRANGIAVSTDSLSSGSIEKLTLKPGDAVLVPQNVERHAAMRNTKDIIDIIFKTAMIIATIAVLHL